MAIRVQEAASLRLDEIYRYTRDRWGEAQAEIYITGPFAAFEQIEQVELESETQAATGPKALETTASGPAGHPNRINMVR